MKATNLELKHYCNDFDKIRNVLKKIGATKDVVKTQKDYFFNLPQGKENNSGRLKLRIEASKKFLVYYERPDFIKGKDTASDVKVLSVSDNDFLPFFKKALGVKAVVDKKREVWRKDNAVFHLDSVKGVGNIFEIELQKKRAVNSRDKKIFSVYVKELMPFLGEVIKGSNVDLVRKLKINTCL
jgi:predicted adenylyl cyclase CyaB